MSPHPEYDPEETLPPGVDAPTQAALVSLRRTQSQTQQRISSVMELLRKKKSEPPR